MSSLLSKTSSGNDVKPFFDKLIEVPPLEYRMSFMATQEPREMTIIEKKRALITLEDKEKQIFSLFKATFRIFLHLDIKRIYYQISNYGTLKNKL